MSKIKTTTWVKRVIVFSALFLQIVEVHADVIASTDRSSVELNESFTLKLVIDSQMDVEPDAASLDTDFYVGSRSHISNTTILNGEVSRTRTWTYVLMAKRPGELKIPPINVGSEQSNPVRIVVKPQVTAAPGEADIFITTEVDNDETYVQAQLLFTVKTYRAVATRQPRWSEPSASGVETLVEVAGEEKSYDSMLNGRAYSVSERNYAFFPQESGELQIAPIRFEARVLRDGRITGRKVYQSEAISVVVNPIPPPPDGYPDAAWFPARAVELSQEWSRDVDNLPAGEPITRHVSIVAAGQLQTQIPVLEPASMPGIRIYPDQPELRTVADATGVRALRRDQYALIGTQPGQIELPELALPWWNVDGGGWNIARLPATTLNIVPSPNVSVAPPTPTMKEPPDINQPETVTVTDPLWRRASEALLAVWLITLFLWWWSRRPKTRRPTEPDAPPLHKQQARCLKLARKAALAGDAAALRDAMIDWARLQWPIGSPRNIGDIAKRVSMPLSIELNRFCSASYGPGSAQWDGESLAKALRSFAVLSDDETAGSSEELPPLAPRAAATRA